VTVPGVRPVMVGVDGSAANRAAVVWAFAEADRRGAPLTAMMVIPSFPVPAGSDDGGRGAVVTAECEAQLRRAVQQAGASAVPTTLVVSIGSPVRRLRTEAERRGAAVLVVGRRGYGRLARLLVGSVSAALAQDPVQPLVVVPDGFAADQVERRFVVGVDGSDAARAALRWAVSEAARHDASVDVVQTWDERSVASVPFSRRARQRHAEAVLDEQVAEVAVPGPVKVRGHTIEGHAAEVLLHEAADAALLVIGSRGAGVIGPRMLGSTGHALLLHAATPLAIVGRRAGERSG